MMKRGFFLLAVVVFLMGCTDDDVFSADSSLRLGFSSDTLRLDTLFSQTPSSTCSFWVHNRNDKGIRLRSIRLSRGNQTGFRVNVDGTYLDHANGSQTTNVEIRRNDSIRVFVEMTAGRTGRDEPVLIEDRLLFSLESGVEQQVCLQAWAWDALEMNHPVISGDELLESDMPVVVRGNLEIVEGATLTLRNTTLYFHDGAGIEVYGTLRTENCVLRGDRLDRMFPYLPYDRVSGQWDGIRIHAKSTGNELIRTEIRNPQNGILCDAITKLDTTVCRLTMRECIVHNSRGMGVKAILSYVRLQDCLLSNALEDCLHVVGGIVDIRNCTLAQFYPFSAGRGAALRFSNRDGETDYPLLRLSCDSSILTGYDDDVVMGEQGTESVPFVYSFRNSLLRTPAVTDNPTRFQQIRWETPRDSVQGKDHFVEVNEETLYYDFHLQPSSPAQGLGCYR